MTISATSRGLTNGVCTSTTRPESPYIGQVIFETDTRRQKVWLGSAWSSGQTLDSVTPTLEYLVIAGGGGGAGGFAGGGGGAGGYRTNVVGATSGGGASAEAAFSVTPGTTYSIIVGAGGVSVSRTPGTSSSFSTITSTGGGAAYASFETLRPDYANGGSGGGCGNNVGTTSGNLGGTGVSGQGYRGGNWVGGTYQSPHGGTGGGGAGSQGQDYTNNFPTLGGNGQVSSITGTAITRAGGGGGGSYNSSGAFGGTGGGGTGATNNAVIETVAATSGSVNTGSGGGGGGGNGWGNGADGGSGVVIIRYPDTFGLAFSTAGSPTITNPTGFRVYTFTGSGSITF